MKARKGFTLIELLIVMAIIAALMAVLIPMATGAMKKARATKIAVQLRNFEQGTEQYILSMLPDSDEVETIKDASVVNAGFAEDPDADSDNLTCESDTSNNKITITITYNANDSALADLIKGSLKDAYEVLVNDTQITMVSTVDAFWW